MSEMTDIERMEIDPRWIVPDPHIACAALKGETEVLKVILTAIAQPRGSETLHRVLERGSRRRLGF